MKSDFAGEKSDLTGTKSDLLGMKSDPLGTKSDFSCQKSDFSGAFFAFGATRESCPPPDRHPTHPDLRTHPHRVHDPFKEQQPHRRDHEPRPQFALRLPRLCHAQRAQHLNLALHRER